MIDDIKTAILEFEKTASDIRLFNHAIHSFFIRLKDHEAIKGFMIIYAHTNELIITVQLLDGSIFKELFIYDKEIYSDNNSNADSNTDQS